MITTSVLRELILDTLSPDYLGKYNGEQDAIAFLPHKIHGYYFPPSDWTITGIEVVVIKPLIGTKMTLNGGLKRRQWDLYIKQWSQTSLFHEAVEKMADGLLDNSYQIQSPIYVPYDEKLGIIASARIPIYEFISRLKEG